MMRATDRLYDSLTGLTGDTVYEVSPRSLVMGTSVEYSMFHQEGGSKLPQRVHVQLLEETFQELAGDVFVYVVEPFERGR
jgi:phage gpG-like protein